MEDNIPKPETVEFQAQGIKCVAFVAFGERGLNMRSCQINLGQNPKINIEYLPIGTRIQINDGAIWFDVDEQAAVAIESLFETGLAPQNR